LPFFISSFGNPSGIYGTGREARKAVERARQQTAAAIGAESREILFTSGGSESDNLAIRGTALALQGKGHHLITSRIEHPAVLNPCRQLEKEGFSVTYLDPDPFGRIAPEDVERAIRPDTILVSIMAANNEIGTVQPVAWIGEICREKGICFHTDAVQAAGQMKLDVQELGADLLSLSAHKFHGPKGAGALYIRKGTRLEAVIRGGAQERGLRAGTENVPGIVGLGKAIETAEAEREENTRRIRELRDLLIRQVTERIPEVHLNGHPQERLANNCHFSFAGIESEALLLRLDLAGIAVSGGSACTSGSLDPSHVLLAIGRVHDVAHGSLRLSIGEDTTDEDVNYMIQSVKEVVEYLRGFSPIWRDLQAGKKEYIL
ncbi:MAG: cysteine desulfurase, partial [Lachnospiraceae bacterium]|nr:cysteine desulfurase [Lachnospiraceae bacterium]